MGSSPSEEALKLKSPVRISVGSRSKLLVSNYEANKIIIVNSKKMTVQKEISVEGKPTGVCSVSDQIYVGNQTKQTVDVFDEEGAFLFRFAGSQGPFERVNDLAIDNALERLYVLDAQAARVKVFNFDGTSAGLDIGDDTLTLPTALAVDPVSGSILVSDFVKQGFGFRTKPARIWIFTENGDPAGSIVGGDGKFSRPQGLFVDSAGYVYVTDTRAGEVQVLDLTTGAKVKTLGHLGTGDGELFYPLDVVVDQKTNDVFVADNKNNRITVFRKGGDVP